jgi:hypothetical protein
MFLKMAVITDDLKEKKLITIQYLTISLLSKCTAQYSVLLFQSLVSIDYDPHPTIDSENFTDLFLNIKQQVGALEKFFLTKYTTYTIVFV